MEGGSTGMDNTNGSDYTSRLPLSTEASSTQQTEPKRRNRKRKNTSESHPHAESDNVQRSAKQRRSSLSRTSPNAVASTSSSTSASLPPATKCSSTSAPQPTVGLSMPSISSSSSLGSNSNGGLPVPDYTSTDTPGSSECLTNDFDYHQLDSPATVNSNVLSPFDGDGLSEWQTYHPSDLCFKSLVCAAIPDTICYLTASHKQRSCPMPRLSWADTREMWVLMSRKDELGWLARKPLMFDDHPGLQPRMRAILLDWLNEVCEVYKLHRETYYLAVDYIDRYLSVKEGLKKTHLQLLGITSLFIAAKVEEIYPPKIGEFAYVTDGACTDEDILREELIVLSTLEWKINPVTVMGWLGLYMQINTTSRQSDVVRPPVLEERSTNTIPTTTIVSPSRKRKITDENEDSNNVKRPMLQKPSTNTVPSNTTNTTTTTKTDDAFVYPQFSGMEFAHTAQLIDLCSLDVGMANFKYSVIAAAAISHTFDRKTATFVSGFRWEEIAPCAKWMEPFFQVICDENATSPLTFLESNDPIKYCHGLKHVCPNLVSDSSHIIQTHTTSVEMLDLVSIKIEEMEADARMGLLEASPAPIGIIEPEEETGILTPPSSNRKSLETVGGGGVMTAVPEVAPSDKIVNVTKINDTAVTAAGTWSTY
ncbi:G1/S-specific cyclin-E isoform X2 [Anopheles stephensi]|uniref:G1/S-specific cyclin-E isoform X2 n=1 Tax=Anopheles stephensi TaxID=30069 RepID=UPI001658A3F9|nr:G1/S-specific cyclin-E isoform X2 [Anopheles stephensi]